MAYATHHQGLKHVLVKEISYTDDGSTVDVGVVPKGATVVDAGVVVSVAFNGGTTNTLDIGPSTDTNGFATVLALGTIGVIKADEMATTDDAGPYASDTTIQCVVTSTAGASAGTGRVWVEFLLDPDQYD